VASISTGALHQRRCYSENLKKVLELCTARIDVRPPSQSASWRHVVCWPGRYNGTPSPSHVVVEKPARQL